MALDPADVRAVQEHFGFLRPEPVEKDWYVVRALVALMSINAAPFELIFAGGTGLARAHRLVRRMSEDVDLKIVPTNAVPLSGNQQRSELGKLRDTVSSVLRAVGFEFDPSDPTHHRSRDQNRYMIYHLPLKTGRGSDLGLRPSIQIELTHTTLRRPSLMLPVASFVAEALGRSPELKSVACVSVTETAAEKLVALTRRIGMEVAGVSRNPDPTLVRHIYDLHLIRARVIPREVATLAREIAVTDAAEFKTQYPAYYADIQGETRKALAAIASDPAYL